MNNVDMIRVIRNHILYIFSLLVFSCTQPTTEPGIIKEITFSRIAPIIYKNCGPCHRPGSGAPFDLLTYEDLKRHLHTVQLSINEGLMPPWPADTGYTHFSDEKVLTKKEVAMLNEWIENGAPLGDVNDIPPVPVFKGMGNAGKPDMVVSMRQPFNIDGDNKDRFIMLKIPFELPKDTFIRAIEIVPGNKKLVHHINAHIIQYEEGKKKNHFSGKPYVDSEKSDKRTAYKLLDLQNDDGTYPLLTPSVTNYLPGVEVTIYPEGIGGYRVKKKSALLLDNIHYGPSPIDTTDVTSFNFYFSQSPPKRPTREFILGTSGIAPVEPPLSIPPDSVKKFIVKYSVPEDISLLTINPHMHLLGKSFKAYVLLPAGDTLRLISIPRWDFRWQYFYTFDNILKIPPNRS
jgi:hypothetical protein